MSEGPINPPFLSQPQAPRGVPTGAPRDQVIVDIPKHVDPEWAEVQRRQAAEDYGISNEDVDAVLARTEGSAAPFDPEAYERAQQEAGNPAETMATADDGEEPVTTLTNEQRQWLSTWTTIGRAKGQVKVLGHVFDIETLNAADEMNIGLYVKPYIETPAFARAWTVANVTAGIRAVNGQRIFDSLAPIEDESELFEQKVRIVAKSYPYALTPVYDGIQKLDAQFAELAEILGKQYG
jgi:hypothetical protein